MLSKIRQVLLSQAGFSPKQLFAALQGAWLEPVQGSIWQENTGVTPTTTGGQTIGRIADQSGGGNNATQATVGNRPLLGRRYNLLTYSEDLNGSSWVKANATVEVDSTISPAGTLSADKIYPATSGSYRGVYKTIPADSAVYSVSVYIKTSGFQWAIIVKQDGTAAAAWFDIVNGVVGTVASGYTANIVSAGNGWYRCAISGPATLNPTAQFACSDANNSATATASGTSGLYIWGADLRLTSDVGKDPSYQRITTATDYDYGQYPAAVHDTNDSLVVSLPNLGGGVFSNAGSVYFATPVGMSALHNQSMGSTYTLPALSSDIYSWMVFPQRLSTVQENRLSVYMNRKAGIAGPDYLLDSTNNQLTNDDGEQLLLAQ